MYVLTVVTDKRITNKCVAEHVKLYRNLTNLTRFHKHLYINDLIPRNDEQKWDLSDYFTKFGFLKKSPNLGTSPFTLITNRLR